MQIERGSPLKGFGFLSVCPDFSLMSFRVPAPSQSLSECQLYQSLSSTIALIDSHFSEYLKNSNIIYTEYRSMKLKWGNF